jgi:hypothetical protein
MRRPTLTVLGISVAVVGFITALGAFAPNIASAQSIPRIIVRLPPPPPPPAPTHVRTPAFIVNGPGHYGQGSIAGQDLSSANHFCYFRGISGEYGSNDSILLAAQPSGNWGVSVNTDHGSSVNIECVSLSDFGAAGDAQISMITGFHTSGSGTQMAALYPYVSSMCGLSGVHGAFSGAMNQAVVDISYPNWELTTVNANANAMCVNLGSGARSNEFGNYTWAPNTPDVRMMPVASGICMLTKIQGRLQASDGIYIYEANGYYYLTGYQGGAANGEATCFKWAGA